MTVSGVGSAAPLRYDHDSRRRQEDTMSLRCVLAVALLSCRGHPTEPVRVKPGSQASVRANVLTHHNDNARSGANLDESVLTPATVRTGFGFLYALPVDGFIYAQPLYVADVDLGPRAHHDLVYVATEANSVYAFDATHDGPPLWQRSLGTPSDLDCFPQTLLVPEIGITSTPVIDLVARRLYVVAFTQDEAGSCDASNFHHRLHALDLASGDDVTPPVELAAAGLVPFVARDHLQRAALLLAGDVVYTAFASHADRDPYHGWLFANDAGTLATRAVFVDTPSGDEGGIWMAGQGPAADELGTVYLSTGNGTFDGVANLGDSVLALTLGGSGFAVVDSFTPGNQAALQAADLDLGSMGPLLVPGKQMLGGRQRHLVVAGGKEGVLYLLDRDRLGSYDAAGDHVLQKLSVTRQEILGSPVWLDDGTRRRLFLWPEETNLTALTLADDPAGNYLKPSDASTVASTLGTPGGFLSLSANGRDGAVIWANHPWSPDGNGAASAVEHIVPGVLRAFDANDLSVELWDNRADPAAPAESVGDFAKFCPPTIANGRVYFAAWRRDDVAAPGVVLVFGRLP
jgi:outer membrane protein assembly factor BamB